MSELRFRSRDVPVALRRDVEGLRRHAQPASSSTTYSSLRVIGDDGQPDLVSDFVMMAGGVDKPHTHQNALKMALGHPDPAAAMMQMMSEPNDPFHAHWTHVMHKYEPDVEEHEQPYQRIIQPPPEMSYQPPPEHEHKYEPDVEDHEQQEHDQPPPEMSYQTSEVKHRFRHPPCPPPPEGFYQRLPQPGTPMPGTPMYGIPAGAPSVTPLMAALAWHATRRTPSEDLTPLPPHESPTK